MRVEVKWNHLYVHLAWCLACGRYSKVLGLVSQGSQQHPERWADRLGSREGEEGKQGWNLSKNPASGNTAWSCRWTFSVTVVSSWGQAAVLSSSHAVYPLPNNHPHQGRVGEWILPALALWPCGQSSEAEGSSLKKSCYRGWPHNTENIDIGGGRAHNS